MSEASSEESSEQQGTEVRLERIYLKDASFESPASPAIFAETWNPEIDLQINTRTERQSERRFEVVVTVTVTARLGGRTAFIIEVQQAGLFLFGALPDTLLRRTLGTFCPTVLFPYVREMVDSLAVRGGFPPLQLVPINFEAAYDDAMRRAAEEGSTTAH